MGCLHLLVRSIYTNPRGLHSGVRPDRTDLYLPGFGADISRKSQPNRNYWGSAIEHRYCNLGAGKSGLSTVLTHSQDFLPEHADGVGQLQTLNHQALDAGESVAPGLATRKH